MGARRYLLGGGDAVEVELGDHNEPRRCRVHDWRLAPLVGDFQEYVCSRCGERMRPDPESK